MPILSFFVLIYAESVLFLSLKVELNTFLYKVEFVCSLCLILIGSLQGYKVVSFLCSLKVV